MTIGGVSYAVMESFESAAGAWVEVLDGPVSLRCWWAEPQADANEIEFKSLSNRVYIVLPELFGLNAWLRSVADRLAANGHPALALPLFSRTALDLDLAYASSDLVRGRRHMDASTVDQICGDVFAALSCLRTRDPQAAIHVVVFCFGGACCLSGCPVLPRPLISRRRCLLEALPRRSTLFQSVA